MKSLQTRQQKMELTLQISFRTLPFPCDPVSPTKFTTCFAGATGSAPTAPPPNSSTADWLPLANGNKLRRRRRRALTPLNRQMKGKTACEQAVSIISPHVSEFDVGRWTLSVGRLLRLCLQLLARSKYVRQSDELCDAVYRGEQSTGSSDRCGKRAAALDSLRFAHARP